MKIGNAWTASREAAFGNQCATWIFKKFQSWVTRRQKHSRVLSEVAGGGETAVSTKRKDTKWNVSTVIPIRRRRWRRSSFAHDSQILGILSGPLLCKPTILWSSASHKPKVVNKNYHVRWRKNVRFFFRFVGTNVKLSHPAWSGATIGYRIVS